MISWGLPNWKKIGWHIGKRIKDILNPCPLDPKESEEARKARRRRDDLNGFIYFESFDELLLWVPQDLDPMQQANTPLVDRPVAVHDQPETGAKVLLCHDYSGGFHDYESVRPVALESDMYTCDYLQYIDAFIYFSHKLVCVPPPTWTNTMHRNGVAILGTFILEPQTPHIEQVLEQVDGEFVIARRLATLASKFGFDGWLLNFEKQFPTRDMVLKLIEFISQLRRLMGPEGRVVWYDALNIDNEVKYQNSLTSKNLDFARSANGLFTNYKWTEEKIREASTFATQHSVKLSHVYFGIDVWAQNTDMPGPPRITFPPKGGGGTNTGLAIKAILQEGFAAAIFAPAWPYEHFSTCKPAKSPGYSHISVAKAVDKSMWEGTSLPDHLKCDCLKGRPHQVGNYESHHIIKYAREYPAGSSTFFHTNFQGAFRRGVGESGSLSFSTLGSQSVLPHLLPVPAPIWEEMGQQPPSRVIYAKLEYDNRPYLRIMTKMLGRLQEDFGSGERSLLQDPQGTKTTYLPLFKLNMPADDTLETSIKYECNEASKTISTGFFTACKFGKPSVFKYSHQPVVYTKQGEPCEIRFSFQSEDPEAHVVALGVYFDSQIGRNETLSLIKVFSITVKRKTIANDTFSIEDIKVVEREKHTKKEKRLAWNWQGSREGSVDGVPWSKATGPFSHFIIFIDGKEIGYAYCLEFPLHKEDYQFPTEKSSNVEVCIEGILFDGGKIKSSTTIEFCGRTPHDANEHPELTEAERVS